MKRHFVEINKIFLMLMTVLMISLFYQTCHESRMLCLVMNGSPRQTSQEFALLDFEKARPWRGSFTSSEFLEEAAFS